jgi:hypothetical protein
MTTPLFLFHIEAHAGANYITQGQAPAEDPRKDDGRWAIAKTIDESRAIDLVNYANAGLVRSGRAWLPMETAPRDGTLLILLVEFDEHATEDTTEAAPTIGSNNYAHDGEDRWQFAGWCWTHDHWTEGKGTPVGWLPFLDGRQLPSTATGGCVVHGSSHPCEECAQEISHGQQHQ